MERWAVALGGGAMYDDDVEADGGELVGRTDSGGRSADEGRSAGSGMSFPVVPDPPQLPCHANFLTLKPDQ